MGWAHALSFLGGGLVSPILGFFKGRDENRTKLKLRELDIKEFTAEAAAEVKVAAEATRGKSEVASWAAFRDSYKADSFSFAKGHALPKWATIPLVLLDFIRGLVRPAITGVLLWWVFVNVTPDNPAILHMAAVALGWWFGDHATSQHYGDNTTASKVAALQAWGVPPDKVAQAVAKVK